MGDAVQAFFRGDYMPHGHCFFWQPGILWSHVISDLVIAASYFSIPLILLYIIRRRPDWKFRGLFSLFAAFILLCGITHTFSIFTFWNGAYGLHAIIKVATAIVSFSSAIVLIRSAPKIVEIPSAEQLKNALSLAANEKVMRSQLEYERKAEAIFKFSTELLPTGLLVVDAHQTIRLANRALEKMMGYEPDELVGKNLSELINDERLQHHSGMVSQYMDNPTQHHAMAAGRIVKGKTKQGTELALEISLSVHEFEGEKHAFASVVDAGEVTSQQTLARESNNRIRRAIEATNDGIWEWNLDTNQVWYSPSLLKMIGRGEDEEPDINTWRRHIHPEDLNYVKDALDAHFKRKARYDLVYRGVGPSGQYEWMHTRGDTIFDSEGKPLLMSGILTNINEKKILEKKLNEKTRFLDQVLSRSLTGLYIFDLQKKHNTYVNEEYTRITGYTLDDLHKSQHDDDLLPLFHPEDQVRIYQHFDDVVSEKHEVGEGIEYRFRHKDGHWIWCYSRDSIYERDDQGQPKTMLGAFFEITELKKREDEIRQLALDFLTTFEQAAVGIAHVDLAGNFIKANNKLCSILGYSREQLTQMSFKKVTFAEDFGKSEAMRKELLEGKRNHFALEKRYVKRDGDVIWVLLTVSLAHNHKGDSSHFISVIEDISERKSIEFALAESNRALERFAYSASHDLQEPLRKISAFAGILEERLEGKLDDPEANYQLKRISDAAKRMGEMIHSLLQLSRYSKHMIKKDRRLLSDIIRQVKDDLSSVLHSRNAEVIVNGDVELYVEPSGMQQVLRNLISNSVNYARSDEQPIIEISLSEREDNKVILYVQDNGQGFDESMAEHIFEPFRRLVGREVPGTGMGLAICKQIVQAHDGKITASSNERGALFTIYLLRE